MKKVTFNKMFGVMILFLLLFLWVNSIIFAQDAQSYYKTGYEYFVQENYQKAEEYYKKAIEINPDFEKAHYWLGKVYSKINNYEKAVQEWKEVLRINSQNQYAFWNLINSFKNTSLVKSDNAIDYLNEGNRLIGNPQAYLQMDNSPSADTLLRSIPYFKKSINIESNPIEAYYWLAEVYRILGVKITSQFSYLAIESYEKTINIEEAGNTISFIHPSDYWHAYTRLSDLYKYLRLENKEEELWLRFKRTRALPYQQALQDEGYLSYGYPSEIEVGFEDGEKVEHWTYPEKNITFIVINGEVQGEKEKEQINQVIEEIFPEIESEAVSSDSDKEAN